MKAGFGLVALMCSIGILVYLFSLNTEQVVKHGQPAQREAERIAGVDESGMRAKDSIKLEPFVAGNRLRYMLVTDIVPGGPMDKYYGLKRDDQILAVGPIEFRGDNDSGLAEAMIWEARQRNAVLKVRRDGQEFQVAHVDGVPVWQPTGVMSPESPTAAAPSTPEPGQAQPNDAPARDTNRDTTKALNRQLEQIPGIPR